jgi:hypothetical protein
MSVETQQFVVQTSPTQMIISDNVRRDVLLHAKHACFIGGEGVTTTNGFLLDNGDEFRLTLFEGEVLWAVAASSTGIVYSFVSKQD